MSHDPNSNYPHPSAVEKPIERPFGKRFFLLTAILILLLLLSFQGVRMYADYERKAGRTGRSIDLTSFSGIQAFEFSRT